MVQTDAKRRAAQNRRALATEIVEALHWLGGAAHRDVVVDRILATRRNAGKPAEASLRGELWDAFDSFRDRMRKDGSALFTLPFGEGSLRWALLDCNSVSRAWLAQTQRPGRRVGLNA